MLEKLALSKYVCATRIQKLRMTKVNGEYVEGSERSRIFGHSVALPLENSEILESETKLPRTDISKYVKGVFIGPETGDHGWNIARKLNELTRLMKVNVKKLSAWMKMLGVKQPRSWKKLKKIYKKECAKIIDGILIADDAESEKIEAFAGADIARMQPQMDDPDDDAAHMLNANPGIQNILLQPGQTHEGIDQLLFQKLGEKLHAEKRDQIQLKVSTTLPCEFSANPEILTGAFPYLFLLGLNDEMLQGTAGVRQRITERWLKFYDPRMAESSELLFFLFSQRMRHAAAQQVSLAFKGERATTLMKLIQTPGFDVRLKRAAANPKTKDAKALLRELEPLVRIAGSKWRGVRWNENWHSLICTPWLNVLDSEDSSSR